MRIHQILNEMVVRYKEDSDQLNIIAFQGNIWLFNAYDHDRKRAITNKIIKDIKLRTGLKINPVDDFDQIHDSRPDILTGSISGYNQLYVDGFDTSYKAASSLLIKKVVDYLGLEGVISHSLDHDSNDQDTEYSKYDLSGNIPNIVYHGTNTKYLMNILRLGLRPTDNKNWDFKFHDRIFLTADYSTASFHANRSAENTHSAPVVISVKLPDRNKIIIDFDIASTYHGTDTKSTTAGYSGDIDHKDYDLKRVKNVRKHSPKTDFTRETGIFAYKGSILPKFFVNIRSTFNEENKLSENDPQYFDMTDIKKIKEALDMMNEIGYYDPDYEPEEYEDEQEEDY